MKKVLVALFALTLTTGVFAQDSTGSMNMAPAKQSHDGVIVRDGKVVVIKDGQASTLTDNLTLPNGTVVMANGTAKMSDGTTATLQDGDFFKMDGTKGHMDKKMPMKNDDMDKMKADSTK